MLSDRVSAVVPERSSFLRNYVEYASQCSDAPDIYHVGVGLTVFAGAVAKKLLCPWMAGRILVPNLYTLLVGPSRSSRKTGSMDIGIEILSKANPEAVIPIPGSYEELVTQIRSTPSGLLTYREFGHFLKTTARGYGEPIRTVLMDLYDWSPTRQYTRNLKKGKTIIEPPICLSMLSACSTDLLFALADMEEWTGGFFGRMLLLYGERESFRLPVPWDAAEAQLASTLYTWANAGIPRCGGFAPDAWTQLFTWAQWRDSQAYTAPNRVQTHIAGTATLAAKIALLFACDGYEPHTGEGWLISYESTRKAVAFVETLYLPSIFMLGDKLTNGPWEKDRQRVLDAIDSMDRSKGIPRRDLLRRVKMSSQYMDEILTTLKEEGTVIQERDVIRRTPEGRVIPLFPSGGGGGGSGQKSGSGNGQA